MKVYCFFLGVLYNYSESDFTDLLFYGKNMNGSLEVYKRFERHEGLGIVSNITHFLRRQIDDGVLRDGDELPSLRHLAELWNISYYSVQQATEELTVSGLLYKYPGRGITVGCNPAKIRRIGLYCALQVSSNGEYGFYHKLLELLCCKIQDRKLDYAIWFGALQSVEPKETPDYILEALAKNEVQGVIGILLGTDSQRWFHRLPAKTVDIRKVLLDNLELHGLPPVLDMLKKNDYRRIGIITPYNAESGRSSYLDLLRNNGVKLMPRYQRLFSGHRPDYRTYEEYGYRLATELLSAKLRPDALIVYPDHAARGALMAIIEQGIRVPEELAVFFHRNIELEYFCPFPVTYQDTSISAIADRLIDAILSE